MADQNFIDHVRICCRSGKGGAGSQHFHRDKRTLKGGPDGGDGGRGGNIILRGNRNTWTLISLRYRKHIIAEDGQNGSENNRTGRSGKDVILDVPLGTVARDAETNEIAFEITEDGEQRVLTQGGRGGLGNSNFATATRQTPRFAQPGEPGKEEWKVLELKLLADVGLVGFPNAGKSTLLAALSAAKPEIAGYPFTTLTPNLGIVRYHDNNSFVMADIPGIIENAHLGKGLGLRFLRHIERNSLLLFMVPCDTENINKEFHILLRELELHNPELLDKPRMLAITKCDLLDQELISVMQHEIPPGIDTVFISAVTGFGLDKLKDKIWEKLNTDAFSDH